MNRSKWFTSRFEVVNAILIAVVSLTTAFAIWRTNMVGSTAADEGRQGLIDAIKQQAFESENYRKVYEEAGFAYQFAMKQAEVQALDGSEDPTVQDQAANIRQYLLPNMQLLAQPLATDEKCGGKCTRPGWDLRARRFVFFSTALAGGRKCVPGSESFLAGAG